MENKTEIGGNNPHKIITGTIDYTVTINENGTWQVEYNESVQNKFAANSIMAIIALDVKENCKNFLRQDPKNKAVSTAINDTNRGLSFIKMNWQSLYQILMEEERKEAESAGETIVTTQNPITEE